MLEKYSTNIDVEATTPIPFNNTTIQKGCTAVSSAPATVQLNKCGVYMVSCDASAGTSTNIQLYKDGVAQPQAQSTGTALSFNTLVQVPTNNSCKCCDSPVTLQVVNETATSFDNANICVTKIC